VDKDTGPAIQASAVRVQPIPGSPRGSTSGSYPKKLEARRKGREAARHLGATRRS
jgi:hypothetical protein